MPALDGLRCVAVLMVVLCHIGIQAQGGGFGVDVFFAISGFLITSLLVKERDQSGRIDWGRFYLRRVVRLAPSLIIMLVVCSALVIGTGVAQPQFWLMAAGALFYLTPLTRNIIAGDPIFNHTWSLGVEEYFYLLWPLALIIFAVWRSRLRLLGLLTLLTGVALYFLYALSIILGHESGLLRVAGIAVGCAYAVWERNSPPPRRPAVWIAAGAAMIAGAFVLGQSRSLWWAASSIAAVGTCLVIHSVLASPNTRIARMLSWRPAIFLGVASYEIYLWHESFLQIWERVSDQPFARWAWLVALVSIGVAILAKIAVAPLQGRLRRVVARGRDPRPATTGSGSTRRAHWPNF